MHPTYAMLCSSGGELHCISAYRGEEEGKCGFVLTPLLIACERQRYGFFCGKTFHREKKSSVDESEGKVKKEKKSLIIES